MRDGACQIRIQHGVEMIAMVNAQVLHAPFEILSEDGYARNKYYP